VPNFRYMALDTAGKRVSGSLEGDDERTILRRLKGMGYFPTEVNALDDDEEGGVSVGGWFRRVSHSDLTTFSRQLADLVKAGLPIIRCFDALIEHTESAGLRMVLEKIREDIAGGKSVADALSEHPRVFPKVYASMVRAGEASGELPEILSRLASYLETERERRVTIRSMLAYPIFVVAVGSLGVSLLVTFIIPRFVEIYEEMDQILPAQTVLLINVSEFMRDYWWAILAGLIGSIVLLRLWSRTPAMQYVIDGLKLKNRLTGRLTQKYIVARFARTFATLLQGGVDVLTSLAVVRDGVGNEVVARALDDVQGRVREGEMVSTQLKEANVFPALVPHMVALGEETGNMHGVLSSLADMYDMEVEASTKAAIAIMGPAVIVALGAVVGFIISAMLRPIFELKVGM